MEVSFVLHVCFYDWNWHDLTCVGSLRLPSCLLIPIIIIIMVWVEVEVLCNHIHSNSSIFYWCGGAYKGKRQKSSNKAKPSQKRSHRIIFLLMAAGKKRSSSCCQIVLVVGRKVSKVYYYYIYRIKYGIESSSAGGCCYAVRYICMDACDSLL